MTYLIEIIRRLGPEMAAQELDLPLSKVLEVYDSWRDAVQKDFSKLYSLDEKTEDNLEEQSITDLKRNIDPDYFGYSIKKIPVDELCDAVCDRVKNQISSRTKPAFLLYGPTGSGKSTICGFAKGIDLEYSGKNTIERFNAFLNFYVEDKYTLFTAEDLNLRALKKLQCKKVVVIVLSFEDESLHAEFRDIRNTFNPLKANQPSSNQTTDNFAREAISSGLPCSFLRCDRDIAKTLNNLKTIIRAFDF